ncbi:MAG: hypothetical protein U0175_07775 [Caldilineaceae bacterium]
MALVTPVGTLHALGCATEAEGDGAILHGAVGRAGGGGGLGGAQAGRVKSWATAKVNPQE